MCARRWEEAWKISHCGHCTFHATCNKIFCCFIGALPLFLRGRDVCFAVCRMKMLNSYYIPTIHTDAKILHKRARLCPLKLPHCRQVCGLRSCAFQWIHAIDLLSRPQDFDRIFAGHPFVQWVAFAALLLCFVMQFLFGTVWKSVVPTLTEDGTSNGAFVVTSRRHVDCYSSLLPCLPACFLRVYKYINVKSTFTCKQRVAGMSATLLLAKVSSYLWQLRFLMIFVWDPSTFTVHLLQTSRIESNNQGKPHELGTDSCWEMEFDGLSFAFCGNEMACHWPPPGPTELNQTNKCPAPLSRLTVKCAHVWIFASLPGALQSRGSTYSQGGAANQSDYELGKV